MSSSSRKMVFGRYDYAAFSAFISYAACSLVIPVVLVDLAKDLHFPLLDGGMSLGGLLHMGRSVAICFAMFGCAFMAAKWGKRVSMGLGAICMTVGVFACALSPQYIWLLFALLIAGLGEGVMEGLATPFVQNLHPKDSGRYVNFTHGFWSLGVLCAVPFFGLLLYLGINWRIVVGLCGMLALIPVTLLFLPSKKIYPEDKVQLSAFEVCNNAKVCFKTPRFWLLFWAIFLAGGGEFCLTFWCATFVQLNFESSALLGGIATAVFALGMFLGRTSFGFLIPQNRLYRLLLSTGISATVVTAIIPYISTPDVVNENLILPLLMVILFISGVAVAPFWPSIQSYTVDRMPHLDATMVFVLLSCAGVPGCGFFTYLMGIAGDHLGLRDSFYIVPACFLVMTLLLVIDRSLYEQKVRSRQ